EKLGLKVREAQIEKIPYLLVIGNKEAETQTLAPRRLGGKNLPSMKVEEFLNLIAKENDPYCWRETSKNI
ncbi:MAG: His/Gly/Thr/Pro-type tRNA ligase C-terminal domain-containing protein, partial [Thermodesulfobacteriota bacterium]